MAELLLKELPVHNAANFSKFQPDPHKQISSRKAPLYIPTKDNYPSLEIVSEKNNILLRYLHQSWERKCPRRKRDVTSVRAAEVNSSNSADASQNSSPSQPKAKRSRIDNQQTTTTNNTSVSSGAFTSPTRSSVNPSTSSSS